MNPRGPAKSTATTSGRASGPAVPAPCGGNTVVAQRKPSGGAVRPPVPPPCGGNAVAVQRRASGPPAQPVRPPVPPPCGGSAIAVQRKPSGQAGRPPVPPPCGGAVTVQRKTSGRPPAGRDQKQPVPPPRLNLSSAAAAAADEDDPEPPSPMSPGRLDTIIGNLQIWLADFGHSGPPLLSRSIDYAVARGKHEGKAAGRAYLARLPWVRDNAARLAPGLSAWPPKMSMGDHIELVTAIMQQPPPTALALAAADEKDLKQAAAAEAAAAAALRAKADAKAKAVKAPVAGPPAPPAASASSNQPPPVPKPAAANDAKPASDREDKHPKPPNQAPQPPKPAAVMPPVPNPPKKDPKVEEAERKAASAALHRRTALRRMLADWIELLSKTGLRPVHRAVGNVSTAANVTGTVLGTIAEIGAGGLAGGSALAGTSTAATAVGAAADGVDTGFSVEIDVRLAQMVTVVMDMSIGMAEHWCIWVYQRRHTPDFHGLYNAMFPLIGANPEAREISKSAGSKVGKALLNVVPLYSMVSNANAAHSGANWFGERTEDALRNSINGDWEMFMPDRPELAELPFPDQRQNTRGGLWKAFGL